MDETGRDTHARSRRLEAKRQSIITGYMSPLDGASTVPHAPPGSESFPPPFGPLTRQSGVKKQMHSLYVTNPPDVPRETVRES